MIASLQVLLSKAISLEIFQSLRSLLTDSSHISLGLPLPLFTLSTRSRTPLRTGASGSLRWTCPNHLSRYWVSFSSIGATPTLSRITSFRTLSLLVCPQNHRNIRISATLSCWTCCLFVDQHSALYNIAGRIAVLLNLPFSFCGTLLSQSMPEACRHFNQPTEILCLTSSSMSPSFCSTDPKYQKVFFWTTTCPSRLTSPLHT